MWLSEVLICYKYKIYKFVTSPHIDKTDCNRYKDIKKKNELQGGGLRKAEPQGICN